MFLKDVTFVCYDEDGLEHIFDYSGLTLEMIIQFKDDFEVNGLEVTEIQHGESQETLVL